MMMHIIAIYKLLQGFKIPVSNAPGIVIWTSGKFPAIWDLTRPVKCPRVGTVEVYSYTLHIHWETLKWITQMQFAVLI